jgi:hypothetical protein
MGSPSDNQKIASALVDFRRRVNSVAVSSQTFWDICREPLYECGLSLTQTIKLKGGIAYVTTVVEHDSGQLIENRTSVKPVPNQHFGPWVEMMAFHNLVGILGFTAPNTADTVFSLVERRDA